MESVCRQGRLQAFTLSLELPCPLLHPESNSNCHPHPERAVKLYQEAAYCLERLAVTISASKGWIWCMTDPIVTCVAKSTSWKADVFLVALKATLPTSVIPIFRASRKSCSSVREMKSGWDTWEELNCRKGRNGLEEDARQGC